MKKISVIVPCYNVENYISFCINSIINQTIGFVENIEIVLVDDKSTDSTLNKLLEYEKQYPNNIIVVKLEKNLKQGAARNIGLQYTTGEYISYVDADDYIASNAYEKLYRKAKNYNADIVEFEWVLVKDHSTFLQTTTTKNKEVFLRVEDDNYSRSNLLLSRDYRRGCTDKIYKRDFIIKNRLKYAEGLFDEESLFTIHAGFCCKRYLKVYDKFYYYFQNPKGTCYNSVKNIDRQEDNAKVWYQLLQELLKNKLVERYYYLVELLFIENYFIRSILYSFNRHIELDLKTVNEMQKTISLYFSKPENNPLIYYDEKLQEIFKYAGRQLTQEQYDALKYKINEL